MRKNIYIYLDNDPPPPPTMDQVCLNLAIREEEHLRYQTRLLDHNYNLYIYNVITHFWYLISIAFFSFHWHLMDMLTSATFEYILK